MARVEKVEETESHACRQVFFWDLMRLAGCGSEMEQDKINVFIK